MEASLCNRKRPCGGAVFQLHQEAHCQPPARKRRCREEEEKMKRRTARVCNENSEPGDVLLRNMRTQREPRGSFQSGSRTRSIVRTGSAFRSVGEIQFCRAEVRLAMIRKTRIPVRTTELTLVQHLTDTGSTETQLNQKRPSQVTQTMSRFEVRSRSTKGPLRTGGLASDQSLENRISRRRSLRVLGPERRTKTRRRIKIHPSVFRGRGQLRLSIIPEEGQVIIHVHEARGLMGTSHRLCDSYVRLAVTSDLNRSITMTTPTVLNNKNPEYKHKFIL